MLDGTAELRLVIPFVEKAEIKLKKVGLELIVRVGTHKRNIILPSALATFRPREARFEAETLLVRFEKEKKTADEQAHQPVGGRTTAA